MAFHQSPPSQGDMKSQLRNFINLLQTSNPAAYKSIKSSGRLSIILSASQPQSSSMDKENSSQSANLSIKNSQFQTLQNSFISQLLKQLQSTGLTKNQQKIIYQLSVSIDEMVKKKQCLENRIILMQTQLARQKQGTDELLEALVKLDEEQRDLWQTYYQLSDKFKQKTIQCDKVLAQNGQLHEQCQGFKKELKFVKNLVYIANQNYEQLEQKYTNITIKQHLQSRKSLIINTNNASKQLFVLKEKRSENNLLTERSQRSKHHDIYSPFDNKKSRGISQQFDVNSSCSPSPVRKTSRSVKSRKAISPLINKDKQNVEGNFRDVYRKMMVKNLKGRKGCGDS